MEKVKLAQNAIQLVKKAADSGIIPQKNLEIGATSIGDTKGTILSTASDSDVRKFIIDNRLMEPQNLAKFLVETYFGQIESIISTINNIETQQIRILIEQCDEAKRFFLREKYDDAERVIMHVLSESQARIKGYIAQTRAVERLQKEHYVEFVIKSRSIKKNIICYNENAKSAIEGYFRAIDLLGAIYAQDQISETKPLFEDYRNFCENILLKEAKFMLSYDYNCNDGFWDSLPKQIRLCSNLAIEINQAYDNVQSADEICRMINEMKF